MKVMVFDQLYFHFCGSVAFLLYVFMYILLSPCLAKGFWWKHHGGKALVNWTMNKRESMDVWKHVHDSQHVSSGEEGKRGKDLENANSSPPLQCSVAWQGGRKKPHKASPTKLYFLFFSLLLPPPLFLPLFTATLIPFSLPACLWWDWFCRLGEYFMLWCYIQQFHSAAPLIKKKARCFIIKRG